MNKKYPGFTMVELATGFALIGLVSILAITVYIAHYKLFSNQSTSIEVSSQNKIAIDEISNQIRESAGVANNCSSCGSDTASSSVLILKLWPLDASGEPFDPSGSAFDYVVYKRSPTDNTKLLKLIHAAPSSHRTTSTRIMSTNVTTLNFQYDNADPQMASEVTATMTNAQTVNGKTQTANQSVRAIMRNK